MRESTVVTIAMEDVQSIENSFVNDVVRSAHRGRGGRCSGRVILAVFVLLVFAFAESYKRGNDMQILQYMHGSEDVDTFEDGVSMADIFGKRRAKS